jgi:hypothetical protein
MTTDMHMFGVMFAPNDDVTLMAMLNVIDKKMQHLTFAGGKGQTLLDQFTTHSSGLGDVKLSALTSLYQGNVHKVHLNFGLSLPTAKIDNTDVVLTPMNMQVEQRLPYGMQLGTGTFDLMFGATYSAHFDKYNWGGQINYTASIESENDQGYQIGDRFWATWWTGYEINPALSTSLRLIYRDSDKIKGIDSHIIAPVATADPNNYGGNNTALALGLNYMVQTGILKGHRLALEYESVLTQKVNGIQLQMSDMLTIGYQVSF